MRPGDPVITTKNQGMFNQIPEGAFGIVRESGFLGDVTVEFMPGGRVAGIRQADLEIASDPGPLWMQRSNPPAGDTTTAAPTTPPVPVLTITGVLGRLMVTAVLLAGLALALHLW